MPDINTLFLFVLVSAGLAITPGPDNMFVLTQSAMLGKRAGIWVTMGLCSGLLVHTLAVTVGVASIIATSSIAFATLKFCGAVYLLFLAYDAATANPIATPSNQQTIDITAYRLIIRGFVMNITNPKVAIFFLAFLPQFVNTELNSGTFQIYLLGLLFMVTACTIFSAIAIFAGKIGEQLRQSAHIQVIINRISACIFVFLALRLVLYSFNKL